MEETDWANDANGFDLCVFGVQRNGKTSACNVVKVIDNSATRPERMITRLKINSIDDSVPRVIVIRPPKGPDGIGFGAATRMPRLPGRIAEKIQRWAGDINAFHFLFQAW